MAVSGFSFQYSCGGPLFGSVFEHGAELFFFCLSVPPLPHPVIHWLVTESDEGLNGLAWGPVAGDRKCHSQELFCVQGQAAPWIRIVDTWDTFLKSTGNISGLWSYF